MPFCALNVHGREAMPAALVTVGCIKGRVYSRALKGRIWRSDEKRQLSGSCQLDSMCTWGRAQEIFAEGMND